jgi:hypothetical protein
MTLTPKQIQDLQEENAMLTGRCEAMTTAWKNKAREAGELSRAVLSRDQLLSECVGWLELLTNLPHYEKRVTVWHARPKGIARTCCGGSRQPRAYL